MRRSRVVLDTNVVVSAHLNAEGFERHVLDLVLAGKLQIAVSEPILTEYEGVLRRPRIRHKTAAGEPIHPAASESGSNRTPAPHTGRDPRSGGQPLPGVRRGGQGGLPGDRQQTPFPRRVGADAGCKCTGVTGVDYSGSAAMKPPAAFSSSSQAKPRILAVPSRI